MRLDDTDLNILRVLQENGRLSFRQISERVDVSVPTVSNKISNMKNMGIIRGYRVDLDPEVLGEISVTLNIKTKPSELESVARNFRSNEHVRKIFILSTGRLLLTCTFTDSHQINEFIMRLGDIPEIIEYDIANVVSVIKEQHRALVDSSAELVLECPACNSIIMEDEVKVKINGQDYYFCSETCAESFKESKKKLKA